MSVARTAVEVGSSRFRNVKDVTDPLYLPGALKYGDLPVLAALAAPGDLLLSGSPGFDASWLRDAYRASGRDASLQIVDEALNAKQLVSWLTR